MKGDFDSFNFSLGWQISNTLSFALFFGISCLFTYEYRFFVVFGLGGLLNGLAQWAVLRKHIEIDRLWIPATAGGCVLGVGLRYLSTLGDWINSDVYMWIELMSYLSPFILMAIFQWLVLRQTIKLAGLWLVVKLLGTVGILAVSIPFFFVSYPYIAGVKVDYRIGALLGACMGFAFALITGYGLLGMFRIIEIVETPRKPKVVETPGKPDTVEQPLPAWECPRCEASNPYTTQVCLTCGVDLFG